MAFLDGTAQLGGEDLSIEKERLVSQDASPSCLVLTHPKIRGAGIKVQQQRLARRANGHLAKILRVILLVLCPHLSSLCSVRVRGALWSYLLPQVLLLVDATAAGLMKVWVGESTLVELDALKVRAWLGGLKAEAIEQVDVRLGAVALVVFVADGPNLAEAALEAELCLDVEDGLHGA